jgi:tRNA A37 N6-isopentenylltransferase MiaA
MLLWLVTPPPSLLSARCAQPHACVQVLEGLLDEAHALRQAGITAGGAPIARAIGYRQALEWLEGIQQAGTADGDDVRRLAAAIQAASRQLAGGQIKFHRGDEHFEWVDASMGPEALAAHIAARFSAPTHAGV